MNNNWDIDTFCKYFSLIISYRLKCITEIIFPYYSGALGISYLNRGGSDEDSMRKLLKKSWTSSILTQNVCNSFSDHSKPKSNNQLHWREGIIRQSSISNILIFLGIKLFCTAWNLYSWIFQIKTKNRQ